MKQDNIISRNPHLYLHDANALVCESEAQTAMIILNENGIISACNQAASELLGDLPRNIAGREISCIVPQFAETALLQDGMINPNVRFLSHIGYPFMLVNLNGEHFDCTIFFNEIKAFGKSCIRMIVRPVFRLNTLN